MSYDHYVDKMNALSTEFPFLEAPVKNVGSKVEKMDLSFRMRGPIYRCNPEFLPHTV